MFPFSTYCLLLIFNFKIIFGLSKKNQKYARTIPFRNQHQGKVKILAVFFERMLTVSVQSEDGSCGILSKKIASKGVWGNGRFPQLNFRSALAAARASVWIFICLPGCLWLLFKLDWCPNVLDVEMLNVIKRVYWN